jgi:hypothetical protein
VQLTNGSLDRFVARLLMVELPASPPEPESVDAGRAERAFSFSLIFSGVRCILQYAVLPFVLPLVGVASDAALPVMLLINIAAMISIFYSLRRFWKIGYARRWQYLVVALTALLILTAFTILDVRALLAK